MFKEENNYVFFVNKSDSNSYVKIQIENRNSVSSFEFFQIQENLKLLKEIGADVNENIEGVFIEVNIKYNEKPKNVSKILNLIKEIWDLLLYQSIEEKNNKNFQKTVKFFGMK